MELICTFRDIKRGRTVTVNCPIELEELKLKFGLEERDELEYLVVDATEDLVGENTDLKVINKFADMIEDVDDDLVVAVNEVLGYKAADLVGIDFNFYDCSLYPEVNNKRELGEYIVDEIGLNNLGSDKLKAYFDYEAYGRDIDIEQQGGFSSKGYVYIL